MNYKNLTLFIVCLVSLVFHQTNANASTDKMGWFTYAKYGLFIHWGVYSVPSGVYIGPSMYGVEYTGENPFICKGGSEWLFQQAGIPREIYKEFAYQFTAENFNPHEWVSLIKENGIKYIIFTVKHHDGFVMYPSLLTDWCTSNSALNGRDLTGEIIAAAKSQNIKIGLYFSQNLDWMAPGSFDVIPGVGEYPYEDNLKYIEYTANMITEFMDRYGQDISTIWWDIYQLNVYPELARKLKYALESHPNYTPDLIQNDRLSPTEKGDYDTYEIGISYIPSEPTRPFEQCFTTGQSWGYHRYGWYYSSIHLLHHLLYTNSKGGNFLLNIGPKPDGTLTDEDKKRITEIGNYVTTHEESIYATEWNGFKYGQDFGVVTRKGNTLYLHYYQGDTVVLNGVSGNIQDAILLKDGTPITYAKTENGYQFTDVPKMNVVKVTFESLELHESRPLHEHLTLSAISACSSGVELLDFETTPYYSNWDNLKDSVMWSIDVKKGGLYDISVSLSSSDYGSGILSIGKQSIRFFYPAFSSTTQRKIGCIYLPAGEQEVVLQKVSGADMKVQNITFSHVEGSYVEPIRHGTFEVLQVSSSTITIKPENLDKQNSYTVSVYSINGMRLYSSPIACHIMQTDIQLPTPLPPGLYLVVLECNRQKIATKKIHCS